MMETHVGAADLLIDVLVIVSVFLRAEQPTLLLD